MRELRNDFAETLRVKVNVRSIRLFFGRGPRGRAQRERRKTKSEPKLVHRLDFPLVVHLIEEIGVAKPELHAHRAVGPALGGVDAVEQRMTSGPSGRP